MLLVFPQTLSEKVSALHVGTHSPHIHAAVRATMLNLGWILELDLEHNPRCALPLTPL